MSTSHTLLIRWAILLLTLAALAKAGRFRRELPRPVADQLQKYLLRRGISGLYCQSQLKLAGENFAACLKLCDEKIHPHSSDQLIRLQLLWYGFNRRIQFNSRRNPCFLRCWHRYRLVLPLRGDAYDQLVVSAGCNATSDQDQRRCRKTSFQAALTADLSAYLTPKQRYQKIVCEFSCGQMFSEAAALDDCKANCNLKQLFDADAYQKLTECTAKTCADKTGEELDACKQECHAAC